MTTERGPETIEARLGENASPSARPAATLAPSPPRRGGPGPVGASASPLPYGFDAAPSYVVPLHPEGGRPAPAALVAGPRPQRAFNSEEL